ncbi:MAG TPA: response regulator [Myxococcaceae bacterium]|nr:response regulator [Myxococcaceae bacterium]
MFDADFRGISGAGKVLVVEDDEDVLRSLVTLLSADGHEVRAARNGPEALQLLAADRFDAVLCDVMMPRLTGTDLLRFVRQTDLDLPVVLMSAAPDVDSAVKAVEYGAFRYLTKPIPRKLLQEVMGRAVRLHRLAQLKREAPSRDGDSGKESR